MVLVSADAVALCLTVEESPKPAVESIRVNCRDCDAELWCSRGLHNRLPPGVNFSCQNCLTQRLKNEKDGS